jgi:hypothetical protein
MARELSEIEQNLNDDVKDVFDNESVSKVAEWRLWVGIFSRATWSFEKVRDIDKALIENTITQKQPPSLDWLYEKVMEFQGGDDGNGFQGDNLILSESGILRYELIDATRRIINQATLTEIPDGTIVIKVAKKSAEGELEALSANELLSFTIYINRVKYPGTVINVTSLPPDLIKQDVIVYYDPIFLPANVLANIELKMTEFKDTLGFNDKFFNQKYIDYLLKAEGVVSIKTNNLSYKNYSSSDFSTIDVVKELAAGYFNYQATDAETEPSVINLIDVNTLY